MMIVPRYQAFTGVAKHIEVQLQSLLEISANTTNAKNIQVQDGQPLRDSCLRYCFDPGQTRQDHRAELPMHSLAGIFCN
jgi:hypothetical protein